MREKTRMRKILAFLAVAVSAAAVLSAAWGVAQSRVPPWRASTAPPPPPAYLQAAESYEESAHGTRLAFRGGPTVLVDEYRAQPLVSLQAYVPGGFLDDPEDAPGLAAVTAMTRLGAGESASGGAARRKAQALGGVLHGRAEARRSLLEITVPAPRWKQALRLQMEALLTPLGAEAARREIDAASENLQDALSRPDIQAEGLLRGLALGPRWQRRAAPAGVSPEKVAGFHKQHYVPSAMTLVVAGDVAAGEVLAEVHRLYIASGDGGGGKDSGARPSAPAKAAASQTAAARGETRRQALAGGVAGPRLYGGFPAPRATAADGRALEVAAAILGMGEASVLNTRLRDGKGSVLGANARFDMLSGDGLFAVRLDVAAQDPQAPQGDAQAGLDRAELGLWTELEILRRLGPPEADLARAVAWLERAWWERMATVEGRGRELARREFRGEWKRTWRYPEEIRQVAAADVKRAAGRYLAMDAAVLVDQLPVGAGDGRAVRPGPSRASVQASVEKELAARAAEVVPAYKIPAATAAFRANEMRHPFQAASILRGPELYIREDHASPLVEMGLFFLGGEREGSEDAVLARLMLELMLPGADDARQLEIYGGRLDAVAAGGYFGYRLAIPSPHLAAGFEYLKKALKAPAFADAKFGGAQFEELKRRRLARLAGRAAAGGEAATDALRKLSGLSLDAARNWHAERIRNVKPFVAVVGDVQGTAPAALFVGEFSGSRMKDGKAAAATGGGAAELGAVRRNAPGRQPTILVGFQAPAAGDADMFAARVLESYLGEAGPVAEEILNRNDGIYRITCEYRPRLDGGSLFVAAKVRAGREAQGLAAVREALGRLGAQPLPQVDFRAARTGAAGARAIRGQARWAQIEALAASLLAGRTLDEHLNFSRDFEDVGEDGVRELARRLFGEDGGMDKAATVVPAGQ